MPDDLRRALTIVLPRLRRFALALTGAASDADGTGRRFDRAHGFEHISRNDQHLRPGGGQLFRERANRRPVQRRVLERGGLDEDAGGVSFAEKMNTVEQELAFETVAGRCASKFTKASNAGMLARHRSSHPESITEYVKIFLRMKAKILKKFQDELLELEHELKRELPKEIQRARELGDLKENSEYHAAKDRQSIVQSRMVMLQKRIAEIAIMNLDKIPHDKAAFGSTVHLTEDNGDKIVYQLVMPEEADAAGSHLDQLPIGRAVAWKVSGDAITVNTPNGIRLRDRQASPSTTRRELFTAPENRRSADRQRHGWRLSFRCAARIHEAVIKMTS